MLKFHGYACKCPTALSQECHLIQGHDPPPISMDSLKTLAWSSRLKKLLDLGWKDILIRDRQNHAAHPLPGFRIFDKYSIFF